MLKKIPLYIIILLIVSTSCQVGNFGDIGRNRNPLIIYAGAGSSLMIIRVKQDDDSVNVENWTPFNYPNAVSKIIIDKNNNRLFLTAVSEIYGYEIEKEGYLNLLPGYPVTIPGTIDNFVLTYNSQFLYAAVWDEIHGFIVQSDGSLSLIGTNLLANPPAEDMVSYNNSDFLAYNSTAGWDFYQHDPVTGVVFTGTPLAGITPPTFSSGTADGGYFYEIHFDTITYKSEISSYAYGSETQISEATFGMLNPVSAVSEYNASRGYIYAAVDFDPNIYCIRLYSDGIIDSIVNNFPTDGFSGFTALTTDPYGDFLLFSIGPSIKLMGLNYDGFPDSGIIRSIDTSTVITMKAFRYEE